MEPSQNRAEIVDANFTRAVAAARPGGGDLGQLGPDAALHLLRAQILSRHLDLAARALRRDNVGYYTIGSSGHEGNAAVAHALRPDDPAFLHYRSGAFVLERARQAGYPHAARDVLLGMCAARSEPIAGGRHKVWGSVELAIPPQTSTIASHLPKAVGAAFALGLDGTAEERIVVCSFGDASLNHSTAQGALNTAAYLAFQEQPLPILFVCEDNGIGISVPTAPGWVAASMRARPGLVYQGADGTDLAAAAQASLTAVEHVRRHRAPVFLHLGCVRLLGHAEGDVEVAYRSEADIRSVEARDPVVASAVRVVAAGLLTPDEVIALYESARREVAALADGARAQPGLRDAADVMWPIARPVPTVTVPVAAAEARVQAFDGRLPESEGPLPLAGQVNAALTDLLLALPEVLVFGQDVARKGGIYGVTRRLARRFGPGRVFDTLLDEQWILGLAIGAGQMGRLAVAEVQYLAFLHNAADQLRGEAATLQFFSQAQLANPLVLRLPSYGYQKGFGGHFHNDNSLAALLDVPGLIVASPACGDDAAGQLVTCVHAARTAGRVCVFVEPIALYHTADLHETGDGAWLAPYQPGHSVPLGRARLHGTGRDLLIVTFADGVPMSLRVAARLARTGIDARILDLRWLAPLPLEDLARQTSGGEPVLVVDEMRATGGISERILCALIEMGHRGRVARVASKDSFIPLGPAASHVLVGEDDIERAARALLG